MLELSPNLVYANLVFVEIFVIYRQGIASAVVSYRYGALEGNVLADVHINRIARFESYDGRFRILCALRVIIRQ